MIDKELVHELIEVARIAQEALGSPAKVGVVEVYPPIGDIVQAYAGIKLAREARANSFILASGGGGGSPTPVYAAGGGGGYGAGGVGAGGESTEFKKR